MLCDKIKKLNLYFEYIYFSLKVKIRNLRKTKFKT